LSGLFSFIKFIIKIITFAGQKISKMNNVQLIECVPNFSEGRDMTIIKQITDVIEAVEGVRLLNVDPGKATNRTVVTFVGEPKVVIEAAFLAIKKASEIIDMSKHKGEHPRMGATDVCPLIPIANISMEEVVSYARQLGERAGKELDIPFYLYEAAASKPERKNLATVRSGEYEGLKDKLEKPEWKPDFGPAKFNARAGATAIGARDFLVAYNVNLNTSSDRRANSVAFDVREKGRIKREGNPITGKVVTDANGEPMREEGMCKGVKAIGWYIEEYGLAQISMNITDINQTPLHEAFEACRKSANSRGLRVTGSELVGLVPKKVLIDAGKYYLKQQQRSTGIAEEQIIHIAINSLGLNEISKFDPKERVIEYMLADGGANNLVSKSLVEFANETASESMAPGGGSISAYYGSLGASLATMVANLSANKRGWDHRIDEFSAAAEKGQALKDKLLGLVDTDTMAFNKIIEAMRMSKNTDEEVKTRKEAIISATKFAIEVPYSVMTTSYEIMDLAKQMALNGNQNSISDAGVGALGALAAIEGAYLNVMINCNGFEEKEYVAEMTTKAEDLLEKGRKAKEEIFNIVLDSIK
jgi:glutamate formiminotransferase/formiminotetrahydrofolate cyclodeaminase